MSYPEKLIESFLEDVKKGELVVYGESTFKKKCLDVGNGFTLEIEYLENDNEIHSARFVSGNWVLTLDENDINTLSSQF